MKILIYTLFLIFSFQTAKGQAADTIVFHGNIVNDVFEEKSIYEHPVHDLYFKKAPQRRKVVKGRNFSVRCTSGDTLVLEALSASPFRYRVEFVAKDTVPQDIHVWTYPASCDGWYRSSNYQTTVLSIKKDIRCPELAGTYKQELKYNEAETFGCSILKLLPTGIFESLSNPFNLDGEGAIYYTGKWRIEEDTLICKAVPGLFPPPIQQRYSGQTLYFDFSWEPCQRDATNRNVIYRFLIRKRGLIAIRAEKGTYRKVKPTDTTEH